MATIGVASPLAATAGYCNLRLVAIFHLREQAVDVGDLRKSRRGEPKPIPTVAGEYLLDGAHVSCNLPLIALSR